MISTAPKGQLLSVWVFLFFNYCGRFALPAAFPSLQTDYSFTFTQLGVILFLRELIGSFFFPLWIRLCCKSYAPLILFITGLITGGGLIGLAFANSFASFLAIGIIYGIALEALVPLNLPMIERDFSEDRASKKIAILFPAFSVLLAVALHTSFGKVIGTSTSQWKIWLLGIGIGCVCFSFIPAIAMKMKSWKPENLDILTFPLVKAVLSMKVFTLLLIINCFNSLTWNCIHFLILWTWLAGLGAGTIWLIVFVSVFLYVVGALMAIQLRLPGKRIGHMVVAQGGLFVCAAIMYALADAVIKAPASWSYFMIVCCLIGFVMGWSHYAVEWAIPADLIEEGLRPTAYALMWGIPTCIASFGSLAIGIIGDSYHKEEEPVLRLSRSLMIVTMAGWSIQGFFYFILYGVYHKSERSLPFTASAISAPAPPTPVKVMMTTASAKEFPAVIDKQEELQSSPSEDSEVEIREIPSSGGSRWKKNRAPDIDTLKLPTVQRPNISKSESFVLPDLSQLAAEEKKIEDEQTKRYEEEEKMIKEFKKKEEERRLEDMRRLEKVREEEEQKRQATFVLESRLQEEEFKRKDDQKRRLEEERRFEEERKKFEEEKRKKLEEEERKWLEEEKKREEEEKKQKEEEKRRRIEEQERKWKEEEEAEEAKWKSTPQNKSSVFSTNNPLVINQNKPKASKMEEHLPQIKASPISIATPSTSFVAQPGDKKRPRSRRPSMELK